MQIKHRLSKRAVQREHRSLPGRRREHDGAVHERRRHARNAGREEGLHVGAGLLHAHEYAGCGVEENVHEAAKHVQVVAAGD